MNTQLPVVATVPAAILVDRIHPNQINPRRVSEKERGELVESLKAVGQLSPLWVRPHRERPGEYEIVDGERRWWGAKAAGVPVLNALVGDWSDEHVIIIALTTGTQQKKLDPIAEARGFRRLKEMGHTLRDIADSLGCSHTHVMHALAVIEAPEALAAAVAGRGLSLRTAVELARVDAAQIGAAIEEVLEPTLTGQPPLAHPAVKDLVRRKYGRPRPSPVVGEGQVGLSAEESLRVFPPEAVEPAPASGYVAYTRPIPADLLKPEVSEKAPVTFADVVKSAQVYVAVDGADRSVPLVKLSEAMAAVSPEDRHIFREEVARGAGIPKPKAGEPPSRRVEEEVAERERKKAEKAQRKKDKAIVAWLGHLRKALAEGDTAGRLPFWTLLYELAQDCMGDDDIALLLEAEEAEAGAGANAAGDLDAHAATLPLAQMVALVAQMFILPRLRAQGVNGSLAKEWHEAVVNPPAPTEPEAVAFQSLPPEEARRCTEIAKAHAAGMSVPKIARDFSIGMGEICGMLEMDETTEAEAWEDLRRALGRQLARAGVSAKAFAPMIKLQLGRDVPMGDLVPEELTKLIEAMDRIAATKTKKPAAPEKEDES